MFDSEPQSIGLAQLRALTRTSGHKSGSRAYPAEAYLQRLKPHLPSFGITRLADITGLDRIGVPVVQTVRPLALSNAVNQGKGMTLAEAAVASVMEALETYFGERLAEMGSKTATPAEVYGAQATTGLKHYLISGVSEDWIKLPLPFVEAIDLSTGSSTWVPAALVSTDYTPGSMHANTPFERTTTGLGGGGTREEALIHALYETLERIATGRAMKIHGFFERYRVDPDDQTDAATAELLGLLERKKLLYAVYECPPPGDFPAVWVRLLDANQSATALPYHADGFACRETAADAIRAALLEAVQTRASVIAGSREDITWRFYPKRWDQQVLAFERSQMQTRTDKRLCLQRSPAGGTITSLIEALASEGLRPVAVPLAANDDIPLHVIRVLTFARPEGSGQ